MLDAVTLLHSDVTFSTCCDEECTMKAINKKYYPLNVWCPPKGHTYLNKPVATSCRFV